MIAPLAAFAMLSALDPAPAEPTQADHWLSCTTIENARFGRIIVDNIALAFFDTGSATITPQAAAMLDGFVSSYRAPAYCRAMIEGHADRAGPAHRNLRLSRRRARAVAAYLRRRGFAAPIVVRSHGETRPLVETADGVGEAQNRYVVVYVIEGPRRAR